MYQKYVELREKNKTTDYKVSKGAGVTKSTFSDWKTGRSIPKLDKLQKLADYFGVPITYFLEG
ncbi:helix-turn-helix transcriptional regulator [Anaerotignum propionicum]|uniref:helix-turn-helix domain-containing protein n=1 Tax=Anaerotignum propionicum TaxID=28446 RepID=UPI0028A05082|nr:helix-turn-helix transcriptional regulator [Anaerotignum propionicum]